MNEVTVVENVFLVGNSEADYPVVFDMSSMDADGATSVDVASVERGTENRRIFSDLNSF